MIDDKKKIYEFQLNTKYYVLIVNNLSVISVRTTKIAYNWK